MSSELQRLPDVQVIALSGAISGFFAGIIVCPLDVAKTRIQAQGLNKKYSGIKDTLQLIYSEEGVRGLYRGLSPIVLGYFPTWMIYFTVYENCKQTYPKRIKNEFLVHSLSAITAGAVSTSITNPIWVVKTRLILQNNQTQIYSSTIDCFRKMYVNEGFKVFYSGLVPSLFGLFHVAIHFPVYEELKKLFNCDLNQDYKLIRLIMASSLSKMCASTLTYPHEILRTRLQSRSNDQRLLGIIRTIYLKEGFFGFYSGFTTNLARTVPASAITLVSFEYVSKFLRKILTKQPVKQLN